MQYEDISFAHVFDEDVRIEQKANRLSLVLYKHFDEQRNNYEEFFGLKYIERFIENNSYPLVLPLNERGKKKFYKSQIPTMILFRGKNSESKEAEEIFRKSAVGHKGKV